MKPETFIRENVIPFIGNAKPMKDPALSNLLEYWERLRAGRIAPMRSQLDPGDLEDILEHTFILERLDEGNIRFRVAGMQLCELMGMEVRGMPANAIIDPDGRDAFDAIAERIFRQPEIIRLALTCPRIGLPPLDAEMLLLPMQNDLGDITRVLGALVVHGGCMTPPHRLTVRSKKVTRIVTDQSGEVHNRQVGFAEAQEPYVPAPRYKKPNLTLVKT